MLVLGLEPYEAPRSLPARVTGAAYEVRVRLAPYGSATGPGSDRQLVQAAGRFADAPELIVEEEREGRVRRIDVKTYVDRVGVEIGDGDVHTLSFRGRGDAHRHRPPGAGRQSPERACRTGTGDQGDHTHAHRAFMKQLLVSRDSLETRVALLEEGRLAELYLERPGSVSLVGNIYKGRVENVLAGMDAAFVDIGLERNGFLYVDEVVTSEGGAAQSRKITNLLQGGKELLVQVTRDAMGGKGPRLTTQLGLAGRYLVYMPNSGASGVSRRLDDQERERLRSICKELKPETGGLIIRTAAEGADEEAIARDLRFLQRVWGGVERRSAVARAPSLAYTEAELAMRAVRDLLGPDFGRVLVDDERLHRRLVNYLRAVAPELAPRVELYQGTAALFEQFGVEGETKKALARRVELPSGGYVVIDHTEAMTVIDVNTGRYVGKRFLEDTTLKTNLEACREIVRQLRLRDIGGIIVIDFIDMTARANREAVLAALEVELAQDRTKTYVVEISPLGLVEMTRQNVTRGLREVMTRSCPACGGEGRVLSEESALIEVERRLRSLALSSVLPGLRIEVHPRVAARLLSGRGPRLQEIETQTGHRLLVQAADETVPLDHLAIVPD